MLTAKNTITFGNHRVKGTARSLRKKGGREIEKWVGHVKRAVMTNWTNVMRSPGENDVRSYPRNFSNLLCNFKLHVYCADLPLSDSSLQKDHQHEPNQAPCQGLTSRLSPKQRPELHQNLELDLSATITSQSNTNIRTTSSKDQP